MSKSAFDKLYGTNTSGYDDSKSFCWNKIGCDPDVKGYRLLVMSPPIEKERASGIQLPDTYVRDGVRRCNVGQVLKVGPTAFTGNLEAFAVQEGEWIQYSIMEREEAPCNDISCYYINDSRIFATISEEDLPKFIKVMR